MPMTSRGVWPLQRDGALLSRAKHLRSLHKMASTAIHSHSRTANSIGYVRAATPEVGRSAESDHHRIDKHRAVPWILYRAAATVTAFPRLIEEATPCRCASITTHAATPRARPWHCCATGESNPRLSSI